MIDIAATLMYLRPGEEWSLDGTEYDGLTWLSDTVKPTLDEIASAQTELTIARAEEERLAVEQYNLRVSAIHKMAEASGLSEEEIVALLPAGEATAPLPGRVF